MSEQLETSYSAVLEQNQISAPEEIDASDSFDLDLFFEKEEVSNPELKTQIDSSSTIEVKEQDLLITLRDESNKSIATLSKKVTAESFALGASFTSGIFSTLTSMVGSCGVFCAHGIGALAQAGGNGLGLAAPNLGGISSPGFSVDNKGNFRLDGNIDSLSKATGISKKNLLSGKFSAEDIFASFISAFGESLPAIFGFNLVTNIIDGIFDNFVSNTEASAVA